MYKRGYQYVISKWEKTELLMEDEDIRAYMPDTQLLTYQSLLDMLSSYPVVFLKPDNGMKGKGIIRVKRRDDAFLVQFTDFEKEFPSVDRLRLFLKRIIREHQKYLIQEGIALLTVDHQPIDFRVLMQKPREQWVYSGVVGKLGEKNSITTNYASGGKAVPFRSIISETLGLQYDEIKAMRDELKDLSFKIAEKLTETYPGLRELGIDYAIDKVGRIWLIEVNTTPGHRLFRELPNEKIYQQILRNMRLIYTKIE